MEPFQQHHQPPESEADPVDEATGPVNVDADGTFAFEDTRGCRWSGHLHLQDLERGRITGEFGATECAQSVPESFAYGQYYADGLTFCDSGGNCVEFDQGIALTIDWDVAVYGGTTLEFLR